MELYDHGNEGDVLILAADGGLDRDTAEAFVDQITSHLESGTRKLVVDCRQLHRITSYGVGVLVRLHTRFADNGGRVKLAEVHSLVVEILERTGLAERFEIYHGVEDAIAAFATTDGR
jgi:anti-anti-sigma factor